MTSIIISKVDGSIIYVKWLADQRTTKSKSQITVYNKPRYPVGETNMIVVPKLIGELGIIENESKKATIKVILSRWK